MFAYQWSVEEKALEHKLQQGLLAHGSTGPGRNRRAAVTVRIEMFMTATNQASLRLPELASVEDGLLNRG